MPMPSDPIDDRARPTEPGADGPPASSPRAPMALVREVQGPATDRGQVAGLAMVCSAAGVALGFALAGSLFAAMSPPRGAIGPAGYSSCSSGPRWRAPQAYHDHRRAEAPMPWLGITVEVGRKPTAPILKMVFADTPAAEAGLRPGDRVTRFAGEDIETGQELIARIRARQPGDLVSLEATSQDGRTLAVDLRLATMPIAGR